MLRQARNQTEIGAQLLPKLRLKVTPTQIAANYILQLSSLDAEDARRPYSDREIVEKLRGQGIILARRTVAKYREEMKILPARLRRRA